MPATLVSAELLLCRSPPISSPLPGVLSESGQREFVQVTLNRQDYTLSSASFFAFDKGNVHVSSLVPQGGPIEGGTHIIVLGGGFADHNVHCTIGFNRNTSVCTPSGGDVSGGDAGSGDAGSGSADSGSIDAGCNSTQYIVRATVINATAMRCLAPARSAAVMEAVEHAMEVPWSPSNS